MLKGLLLGLVLGLTLCAQAWSAQAASERLASRYEQLLLLVASDYGPERVAEKLFHKVLLRQFESSVIHARSYPYDLQGVPANFTQPTWKGREMTAQSQGRQDANIRFLKLFSSTLPVLAYAYLTPGPNPGDNPYHQNPEVLRLYLHLLEYSYSRGLTESAWTPDHAGTASERAAKAGLVNQGGDFSGVSLHFGGYIQSIFLMRESLAEFGLLEKYRRVAHNLAINNGTLFGAFFAQARAEAGINHETPLPQARQFYLNSDGMRLFVDYFIPYFLLIEDAEERQEMEQIIRRVILANIAIRPGVQGTIKPDGVGFHHGAAYVGAYSPFTFEASARLLYLLAGTDYYEERNLSALKLALQSFRFMVQKYSVSSALRGRLIAGVGDHAGAAVLRAMALLAHPDGLGDLEMRGRFNEFFSSNYFFSDTGLESLYACQRSVPICGLGMHRLVVDMLDPESAAEVPSGVEIKPYAAAAFFRRNDWLVTAKGFSRYLWDYEGPLEKRQNSFGQNWSYGLLQVFSAGDPVSEAGSGYDLGNGWDWYHVPGTTASYYEIKERSHQEVVAARRKAGIRRKNAQRNYNSAAFVGGVTLGDHGFFVQELEGVPFTAPTNLAARKSYFFVGDKVLALGTHIRGGTRRDPTHTTLFQTRVAGGAGRGSIDGETGGLSGQFEKRVPAGSSAMMTDSVGNSYFLMGSSSELQFSRRLQHSLTPGYEPTSGQFLQAYLDHGIAPDDDSYAYVLIPSDPHASKLAALASNPSGYYQLVATEKMHLVYFPEWHITAYAFYETLETPPEQLLRSVSLPAAVIVQRRGGNIRLAASVPDLGWDSDDEQLHRGLAYGMRQYVTQSAKLHRLRLVLRGGWELAEPVSGISARLDGDETILEVSCSDGLSRQMILRPAL